MNKQKTPFTYQDFVASIDDFQNSYRSDISAEHFFDFPTETIIKAEEELLSDTAKSVAYFSMEYGIAPSIYNSLSLSKPMSWKNQFFKHEVFSNHWICDYLFKINIDKMLDIPIYGGGLGVLAGDMMKSAADMKFSVVGIGVLWNKGYFKQNFWYKHGQVPEELQWDPHTYPGLVPLKNIIVIDTKEGKLHLRLWKYYIYSYDKKYACPIILLDSNLPQNPDYLQKLTDQLYRSDHPWWKIFQRLILGIGGMKALKELGYQVNRYHLNEGHAAFALLEEYILSEEKENSDGLKEKFTYTCHTPVAAGHDRFSINDIAKIMPEDYTVAAEKFGKEHASKNLINLTFMALRNCKKVNAVAKKHGDIMHLQFPDFKDKITSITNGVHMHTWISESFGKLLDSYPDTFGDWRRQPENLEQIISLADNKKFREDLFGAHQENKRNLIDVVKPWQLKEDTFTLGWARRIAGYKRPALIFHNIDRLIDIAYNIGPIQIIMAGKAHPNDDMGAAHIDMILNHIDKLNEHKNVIKVLILENYDTYFGKLLTNSVDVWLNNPLPPFEASGTSGMKAILNGVLQLSTLDGWVVEAQDDDIGWIFGYKHKGSRIGKETNVRLDQDSEALCDALEKVVKLYYKTYSDGKLEIKSKWIDKMIHCVAKAAFFNTQRMVSEYNKQMWVC